MLRKGSKNTPDSSSETERDLGFILENYDKDVLNHGTIKGSYYSSMIKHITNIFTKITAMEPEICREIRSFKDIF